MVSVYTLMKIHNCGALRDLVPFAQFKNREKHLWRSVTFSKVAGLLKETLLHGCFSRFLNCTHGTKSRNAPHTNTEQDARMERPGLDLY